MSCCDCGQNLLLLQIGRAGLRRNADESKAHLQHGRSSSPAAVMLGLAIHAAPQAIIRRPAAFDARVSSPASNPQTCMTKPKAQRLILGVA